MAHYAFAFDLSPSDMKAAGKTQADITRVYQKELPEALAKCGFTAHPQGSLYHTESEQDPITALMVLQGTLKREAPTFCQFAKRIHVFRMEEWSDVTNLIANRPSKKVDVKDDQEVEDVMLAAEAMA